MKEPDFQYYIETIKDILSYIHRLDNHIHLYETVEDKSAFTIEQLQERRERFVNELNDLLLEFSMEVKSRVLPQAA